MPFGVSPVHHCLAHLRAGAVIQVSNAFRRFPASPLLMLLLMRLLLVLVLVSNAFRRFPGSPPGKS